MEIREWVWNLSPLRHCHPSDPMLWRLRVISELAVEPFKCRAFVLIQHQTGLWEWAREPVTSKLLIPVWLQGKLIPHWDLGLGCRHFTSRALVPLQFHAARYFKLFLSNGCSYPSEIIWGEENDCY